jgi:hypothetical protein
MQLQIMSITLQHCNLGHLERQTRERQNSNLYGNVPYMILHYVISSSNFNQHIQFSTIIFTEKIGDFLKLYSKYQIIYTLKRI